MAQRREPVAFSALETNFELAFVFYLANIQCVQDKNAQRGDLGNHKNWWKVKLDESFVFSGANNAVSQSKKYNNSLDLEMFEFLF